MPVMMKLLILTEAFSQYGYHDMVESSMRGKFWLIFFLKTKLCNIYYKVDIEWILHMFVCLHKNIVHFAKLRILPDREYDNEHGVSVYFARANNELIVCVI